MTDLDPEDRVRQLVEQARRRREQDREVRAQFAAARTAGLRRRHAQKLARLRQATDTKDTNMPNTDHARAAIHQEINERGYIVTARSAQPGAACAVDTCDTDAVDEFHVFTAHHVADPHASGITFPACSTHSSVVADAIAKQYGKPDDDDGPTAA